MAAKVDTHEAKTHLSKLLVRVQAGEEIIIARAGTPAARLVPIEPPAAHRRPGTAAERVVVADDFDAPLPDNVVNTLEL
jgi:prevent-host-death family protein